MKRIYKAFLKAYVIILIVIILLDNGILTFANGGPIAYTNDGDVGFILPVRDSGVEIVSEQLHYRFEEPWLADITAEYEMHNTSVNAVSVMVAFIANNAVNPPEVEFKNQPAEIIRKETLDWFEYDKNEYKNYDYGDDYYNHPNYNNRIDFGSWGTAFDDIIFFLNTGSISENFNTESAGVNTLEAVIFEINFKPDELCKLSVSYGEEAVYEFGAGHNENYQFFYLLEPAQYWKSFRDLTITVEKPEDEKTENGYTIKYDMRFSLDGFEFKKKINAYTAHYSSLPENNLKINIYSDISKDFNINDFLLSLKQNRHILISLILLAALIAFIIISAVRRAKVKSVKAINDKELM